MKKSRFTETQIVGILKEHEAGIATKDLCRRHGVSPATFYNWKAKFGGMEVSDVAKIRALEDENLRLKRIVADQALNIDVLKMAASGKYPRLLRNVESCRRLGINSTSANVKRADICELIVGWFDTFESLRTMPSCALDSKS